MSSFFSKYIKIFLWEPFFLILAVLTLFLDSFIISLPFLVLLFAVFGSIFVFRRAGLILLDWNLSIDVFYLLALIALFADKKITSVLFVCVAIVFSRLIFPKINLLQKDITKEKSFPQHIHMHLTKYFLPFVLFAGITVYLTTNNLLLLAAFFLVIYDGGIIFIISCLFEETSRAITLRDIALKNYKKFHALGKVATLILDKTDQLTYGKWQVQDVFIETGISKNDFWQSIAVAEQYSDNLADKVLFTEAFKHIQSIPSAQKYQIYKGAGVCAQYGRDNIIIGNKKILVEKNIILPRGLNIKLENKNQSHNTTIFFIALNNIFIGYVVIVCLPEKNLRVILETLRGLGIKKIIMVTNDKKQVAQNTASILGVDETRLVFEQEERIKTIKQLVATNPVFVVTDGSIDYPFLVNKNVCLVPKIAGKTIKLKNVDIIIPNKKLTILPILILTSRKLSRMIYNNLGIWLFINMSGIALVLLGILNPVTAIFYSLLTNFIHTFPFLKLYQT